MPTIIRIETYDVRFPTSREPLPDRAPGEWWATMQEIFHTD
jgi:hypothetical protein